MSVIHDRVTDTNSSAVSYLKLCDLLAVEPFYATTNLAKNIAKFDSRSKLATSPKQERLLCALWVLLDLMQDSAGDNSQNDNNQKFGAYFIDQAIADIDKRLNLQLNAILHHPEFQKIERVWRSLEYLTKHLDASNQCKLEILSVSKSELREDFADADLLQQSSLYKHIYIDEYDTPGGEPFAAIISDYDFTASSTDAELLSEIAAVSAAGHCPFIANINEQFFNKKHWHEIEAIENIGLYLQGAEYHNWHQLRQQPNARYLGLTLPKFLLRRPYQALHAARDFVYDELLSSVSQNNFLWGNASFAFAANLIKSFQNYGWCVNIRGVDGGGKVSKLITHNLDLAVGFTAQLGTEMLISEARELEFAEQGFIPLSYYKNSDYGCFFSANSMQLAPMYDSDEATANSKINARLPYVLLSCQLAHYLKVLQRENIGATKDPTILENELNSWLSTLITKMNNPSPDLMARYPLREGLVTVSALSGNPEFYQVQLSAVPHFKIEGLDITLSLLGKMPRAKN